MNKLLLISSLALFTISCKNDDTTEVIDNDTTPILVTKFTKQTNGGQSYNITYKYDYDKILEETDVANSEKIVYTYNGDFITKAEKLKNDGVIITREFTYTNGRVTSEKVTDKTKGGILVYTKAFQYLSDNHVMYNDFASSTYTPAAGHTNIKYATIDAYISNAGNLKMATWGDGTVTRTYNYTHDGQNNPFKNIRGYMKINLLLSLNGETGNNNLLNSNSTQIGVPATYSASAVNTYNDSNFPTKMVITNISSLNPTSTSTYMYEYNK